jgi:hypothetical protein
MVSASHVSTQYMCFQWNVFLTVPCWCSTPQRWTRPLGI